MQQHFFQDSFVHRVKHEDFTNTTANAHTNNIGILPQQPQISNISTANAAASMISPSPSNDSRLNSPVFSTPVDIKQHSYPVDIKHSTNGGFMGNSPYTHQNTPLNNTPPYYSASMPVTMHNQTTNTTFAGAGSYSNSFTSQQHSLIPSLPSSFTALEGAHNPTAGGTNNAAIVNAMASLDMGAEKRRKRRESHNAVERRRRDNINEKIQELNSLVPEAAEPATGKVNKGIILRRTVDYVRQVNLGLRKLADRQRELENVVALMCRDSGINADEFGRRLMYPLGTPVESIIGCTIGNVDVVNEGNFVELMD